MKKILFFVFFTITASVYAQKLKIVSGNFDFLKDQTEVNVVLKFNNALFLKEKFTEAEYLETRKNELLANPKRGEEGWGKWSGEWEKYKSTVYLDDFLRSVKGSRKVELKRDITSKYTLIIDTKLISPGWHAGFVIQPAILSANIIFVETDNPAVTLLEINADGVAGRVPSGMSSEVMEYERISSAYEKVGRLLVREINKGIR